MRGYIYFHHIDEKYWKRILQACPEGGGFLTSTRVRSFPQLYLKRKERCVPSTGRSFSHRGEAGLHFCQERERGGFVYREGGLYSFKKSSLYQRKKGACHLIRDNYSISKAFLST